MRLRDRLFVGTMLSLMGGLFLAQHYRVKSLEAEVARSKQPELMEVELMSGSGERLVFFHAATNPAYATSSTLYGYEAGDTGSHRKQGLVIGVTVPDGKLLIRTKGLPQLTIPDHGDVQ